jgi:hypothetical protein
MKVAIQFEPVCQDIENLFRREGKKVKTERWQSIAAKPEHETIELMFYSFQLGLWKESIDYWQRQINPNLPWAENHFLERVSGVPLNPGVEWRNWPYNKSADTFRKGGVFSHTYMERYWTPPKEGIRYSWGNLGHVIQLLAEQPHTRQAYLPVWFPEDTGVLHNERVPCSLGYHFIMRNNRLSIVYYIRSCDYIRHFRDDVYLTIRLLTWVLAQLKELASSGWKDVKPGSLIMHISSLHMFVNDYNVFIKEPADPPEAA